MQSILSIQSHVVYGYVGNKAAVYPLQYMGYDVWPINTVQFSNHTGYGKFQGEIFTAEHILQLAQGIIDIGQAHKCRAILSGYMGSSAICEAVQTIAQQFKAYNADLLYLCDPVIGNNNCFVKPEVFEFFKDKLSADIITPNQYEAEVLSDTKITNISSLKATAKILHDRGIKTVVITGLKLSDMPNILGVFASDGKNQYLVKTKEYPFTIPVNGTGDLFSSLFLGFYLRTKDIALALQNTVHNLQKVLENTYNQNERELQVLSVKYDAHDTFELPHLTVL